MSSEQDDPYRPTMAPPPPARGRWTILWIILGGVGALVLSFGICCGGSVWLSNWQANDVMGDQVERKLERSDAFREHYGEFESLEWNMVESAKYQRDHEDEDAVFAYDVYGSKGRGVVYAKFSDDGLDVIWIKMETPAGEVVDVFPDADAAPQEEPEAEAATAAD